LSEAPFAILPRLLGELSPATFVERYFARLPHTAAGAAGSLTGLAGWERLGAILERARGRADLLVARDDERRPGAPPASLEDAREAFTEGYTLVVRHAEQWDEDLEGLAAALRRDLAGPANVHLYFTPAGRRGFVWHYDVEDVFVVQASGSKAFSLRKNTTDPWPLLETLPRGMDVRRERSPLGTSARLGTGDVLYVPAGWWHAAQAVEDSVTIAAGVLTTTALDLLDFVRTRLTASPVWRQRLLVPGWAGQVPDEDALGACAETFRMLGADLEQELSDPALVRAFLRHRAERLGLQE